MILSISYIILCLTLFFTLGIIKGRKHIILDNLFNDLVVILTLLCVLIRIKSNSFNIPNDVLEVIIISNTSYLIGKYIGSEYFYKDELAN